jgi:CO/xanthine dehydrogenase Mo-binding subunit
MPQLVWAYESHTDMIARALGLDPLAFRRKNLLRNGRPQATGTVLADAATEEVLERLAQRMNWESAFDRGSGPRRRGRGVAIGLKAMISPTTSVAIVNLFADGSCALYCSTVDMGQGSDTAMAQIAGEVLNLAAERIKVIHPDTDVTPYDMATLGSRSTYHMGNAVRLAAEEARGKIEAMAAELGLPAGSNLPVPELFRRKYGMQAGNIVGVGSFVPPYTPADHETGQSPNVTPAWMVGAAGAEVEVDEETGAVRVLRLVNVADAGRPINPRIVETQLSGAALMQFGFTMSEQMRFHEGQLTNASLADYKIPGLRDIPMSIENLFVENRQASGPFGAKGVGETGTFAVSPAIANAVEDAVGVRLTRLPLTAEAVYRALRASRGEPLEDE